VSYILDALKRSERSRQRHRPLVYRSASTAARVVPNTFIAILIGVLLVGTVVAVYWWRLSSTTPEPDLPVTEVPMPAASASAGQEKIAERLRPPALSHSSTESGFRPLADSTTVTRRAAPPPREDNAGPVPLLTAMPAEFQDRLPPMEVNIHVYSPDPAQRILYINNRAYRQGDEVTGGAVVEEVVPDGVVLYYDAQRFRLPRPR